MDTSLAALTSALKQTFLELKPNRSTLSFLLLIGKKGQGKSSLLAQSGLEHVTVSSERPCAIYYNPQGIVLELSEEWIQQSDTLLEQALKHIERAHHALQITGLMLAIDANPLFMSEPLILANDTLLHTKLLQRFSKALGRSLPLALIFTKLDGVAGFADFFQNDSLLEQKKPLGFSIDWGLNSGKIANNYHARFEQLLEALSQDILPKVHPARSSLKRMLIREFPLQLSKFHRVIHTLLKQIPPKRLKVRAVYFTSAEQGGTSQDYLNSKICKEYALVLPGHVPQSSNYRAYFIEGALSAFQAETQKTIPRPIRFQRYITKIAAGTVGLTLAWIIHHHLTATQVLDDVTKELLAFDAEHQHTGDTSQALYHLSKASDALARIKLHGFSSPTLQHLQTSLMTNTDTQLNDNFIPQLLGTVEYVLKSPEQTPLARYSALKTYIALNQPSKRNNQEIITWFESEWSKRDPNKNTQNQRALLEKTVLKPKKPVTINQQVVRDTRNYLNALPVGYLYYSLLKANFPQDKQPLKWEGFILGSSEVPSSFTKATYKSICDNIKQEAQKFQQENWILERQDLSALPKLLEEAYAYDYLTWWKMFIKNTTPVSVQNYTEARHRIDAFQRTDSLRELTRFIQAQTRPDPEEPNSAFNQTVASQFTALNLVSETTLKDLSLDVQELQQFLNTLAVVHDDGQTAFNITKARFQNNGPRNALSSFYLTAKQLPEPVGPWVKQIADDTWFLLITDTKQYINQQWQQYVYPEYQRTVLNRYPFNPKASEDVDIHEFNRFFATHGILNSFLSQYIKPFLDTSKPEWPLREADEHVLPISDGIIKQFVRANVITAMFFPRGRETSRVDFKLQKISLDPVIAKLELSIGETKLLDTQTHSTPVEFEWPESDALLVVRSIEGPKHELSEAGPWAFFKLLDKLNVLLDKNDSSNLHILFEINGDSGRYLLKTANGLNPFTPGILSDFELKDAIV